MLAFIATMFSLIPKRLVFIAVGALAGVLALAGLYAYGVHNGRQQATVAATRAIAKAYKDRSHENASVDALSPLELCLALGGVRDECESGLRRMGQDHNPSTDGSLPGKP